MKYIILFLSLMFLGQNGSAQESDFNFINFSSKDGLSSNTVNAIVKDNSGYMWFATDDGLNRFDGVNFKVYRHNAKDTTSIGSNTIIAMHVDKAGNLWMSTDTRLVLYNREKDNFINYNFAALNPIRSICSDNLGNIWAGGFGGLLKLDPKTSKTKIYVSNPSIPNQLLTSIISAIFWDSHNRLWIGTSFGVQLYQPQTDDFKSYRHIVGDASSIADDAIQVISEDKNGQLWIGTNDGGVSMLLPDNKHFKSYFYSSSNNNTLSNNRVDAITPDYNGKLWIGTEDGLNILDTQTGQVQRLVNNGRNKYSLNGKSIRSIFIDGTGLYWVGAYQGGVNKYDKNLAFFNLVQSDRFDPFGLSAPMVTSFAESNTGDIYVGTDGGGVNLYHRKTGLFDHINLGGDIENKKMSVLTMKKVGDELWVGTYLKGVFVLNTINGTVKHFMKGNGSQALSSNDIFCIRKDGRGNILIGTNGNGVDVYNIKSGLFHRLKDDIKNLGIDHPINGFIRSIEEDKTGNILIGTVGGGLAELNPAQETVRIFNRGNTNLAINDVQTIYVDVEDNIWIGTTNSGLCFINNRKDKFLSFTEEEGLANNVIYKILDDGFGKLWISTNKGLSSFDTKNHKFKNYSYYNGLQKSTFVLGAGLKNSNGELFFGGVDGFNFFNPQHLNSGRNIPSLVFTDLKISNRSVVPGENAAIKENISVAKEINLDYKQNFSIEFAALNYTAPQENRYVYMLEGFDKHWNEIGTLHTAVFTNLDPGAYTFKVRATSEDGSWSTDSIAIKIYVKPPLWLTIYAYIFYILVIVALLVGLRYRGMSKLKRQFALQQERLMAKQLVEEERREAERLREFDQTKIKFLTNLSHEFRTPISLIIGPVEKLQQQEASKEKLGQIILIKRNARRLLNLVNQLLDFRKLEDHELKLNVSEGDIVLFIKEVAESFRDMSERKQINFNFQSSVAQFYTAFDKDKIERILFNLLSNAFKFTMKGGEIKLKLEQENGFSSNLKIIIEDTGVGMAPDVQEKIFERFFQDNGDVGILNQGSGIGLSITKEFVKLHAGTISVDSILGKGSVFTIWLPLELIRDTVEEKYQFENALGNVVNTPELNQTESPKVLEMLTVLLIEDNEDFRYYLKENLKAFYKIVEAADGKEGWQKALSAHPHVIVSDINMPYIDGITLSKKIKSDKRTSHISVILLTALTRDEDQLRGLETGASDYLTKPFNFEILNVKIRNLLALNQSFKDTYSKQITVGQPETDIVFQSDNEKLLLKVKQYIEDNLSSPQLSVEELAKHLFMSRGSLYNKLIELTGETPIEFIRSVKLNKAVEMLQNSSMKIADISYAVGFMNPTYFARAFKAKFEMLPSEFIALKRTTIK